MHSNKLPCFNKIITHGKYCGNPDEKYTKHFNRLNFNFLWNKSDRIKRNTIVWCQRENWPLDTH